MALLRRTRLVRFGTQVPTFVKRPEREILTRSGPSQISSPIRVYVLQGPFRDTAP
jgi:hypothetical protein